MSEEAKTGDRTNGSGDGAEIRGFRVLLGAGALVFGLLGVSGLFFTGVLHGILGPAVEGDVGGFLGVARLYGALGLAVAAGYVIGAIDPMRNRGLLFLLFIVPLLTGLAAIVAAAKSEVSSAKGAAFAAFNLAYLLLYFRLYPKPAVPEEEPSDSRRGDTGGASAGGEGAEGRPTSPEGPGGGQSSGEDKA